MVIAEGSACTLNFLFRGSDGNRYIGSAGHCILESDGEYVYRGGKGPDAHDGAGVRIGEYVYAVRDYPKDFALIRLDPRIPAEPEVCYFGGPTGINRDLAESPTVLHYYGNGLGIGNLQSVDQPVLPARSAVAPEMTDPHRVYAEGLAIWGDSGSAVISDDGRAVGVLVAISDALSEGSSTAGETMVITRLVPQMKRAARALGVSLHLELVR